MLRYIIKDQTLRDTTKKVFVSFPIYFNVVFFSKCRTASCFYVLQKYHHLKVILVIHAIFKLQPKQKNITSFEMQSGRQSCLQMLPANSKLSAIVIGMYMMLFHMEEIKNLSIIILAMLCS